MTAVRRPCACRGEQEGGPLSEAELFAAYSVKRLPGPEVRPSVVPIQRGPLGVVGITEVDRLRRSLAEDAMPVRPQLAKVG